MTDADSQPQNDPESVPADESEAPAKRRLFRRRARPAPDSAQDAQATPDGDRPEPTESDEAPNSEGDADPPPSPPATPPRRAAIKRDLRRLTEERQESQFHLGGLALELYRRDALTDQVMRLKAAQVLDIDERVQLLDWRLEAMETERRQRKGAEPVVAGSCLSCGADFAPESVFCWKCGTRFAPETEAQSAQTTEIGTVES